MLGWRYTRHGRDAAVKTPSREIVPPSVTRASATTDALVHLAVLADEVGAEHVGRAARSLAERAAAGRFYVACVGQFKRGKSTLINALIGESILPVGVVPVTAVPTIVQFGSERYARAEFADGKSIDLAIDAIEQYVSEAANPDNRKGVVAVEVFVPSLLLEKGMCLVDTPGLGSVFGSGAAATRAFVPHIDAAIVVLGADPPLGREELELVSALSTHVQDFLFVLNKADRLPPADLAQAGEFAARVIAKRLHRETISLFQVSAQQQLGGAAARNEWSRLMHALEELAQRAADSLAHAAAQRGMARLAGQLRAIIREQRDALLRPIADSEKRAGALARVVADADRSLGDLAAVFDAEARRLGHVFAQRRRDFEERTRPRARAELAALVASRAHRWGPRVRRRAMRAAQDIARQHVLPWLAFEQAEAERMYGVVTRRFAEDTNKLLRRVASSGEPELAHLPDALDLAGGFQYPSGFRFHEVIEVAQPASPFRFLADIALGALGATQLIWNDAHAFLAWLVEMNSTRVESDLIERVRESAKQLERTVRELLRDVHLGAERALERTRVIVAQGRDTAQQEVARLEGVERRLSELAQRSSSPS